MSGKSDTRHSLCQAGTLTDSALVKENHDKQNRRGIVCNNSMLYWQPDCFRPSTKLCVLRIYSLFDEFNHNKEKFRLNNFVIVNRI